MEHLITPWIRSLLVPIQRTHPVTDRRATGTRQILGFSRFSHLATRKPSQLMFYSSNLEARMRSRVCRSSRLSRFAARQLGHDMIRIPCYFQRLNIPSRPISMILSLYNRLVNEETLDIGGLHEPLPATTQVLKIHQIILSRQFPNDFS